MSLEIHTIKKYYRLFTLYFIAFGLIVAILTSFINYNLKYAEVDKLLLQRAEAELEYKKQITHEHVSRIEAVIESVIACNTMRDFYKTGDIAEWRILNSIFRTLVQSNRNIMQLRYLDAHGKEVIRVDRQSETDKLKIFKKDEMQDKSDRYYFKEVSRLGYVDFWHSNIDLNIEHGAIEFPLKPTFRVAAPFMADGSFGGVVIANVIMNDLLETLEESRDFNIYISDKDGEVLINPDESKSWSRYLGDRPNIKKIFPEIVKGSPGELRYKPAKEKYVFPISGVFNNTEGLIMIMSPKETTVKELNRNNILTTMVIAAIVLLVSFPLSWLVSFIPSKLQSKLVVAYDDIKKYNEIIDTNIATSQTDKDGKITDVSSKFLEITGYSKDEIVGKKHNVLKHPETSDTHYKDLWETITSGRVWNGEMKNMNKNGHTSWITQVITPEVDDEGNIAGYTSIAQDITDKKIIEKMSVTDRLTGLFNRHKLDEVLLTETDRFSRYKTEFCALLMDIDRFKTINDTFGHQAGDSVLIELAEILTANSRSTDFIGRWGGEEFLVIAIQTSMKQSMLLAEKLRSKVEEKNFPVVGRVTISIGVAQFEPGETIAHFMSRADKALYAAKNSGRNKVVSADDIADDLK